MSNATIDLSNVTNFSFFHNGNLNYFLPEICCLSEIKKVPSDYAPTKVSFVFTMYLTYGMSVDFAFATECGAVDVRCSIITALSKFLGPDKLVCVNGFDLEVAVIPAIIDVTDVFIKDGHVSFSATVESTPNPLNFIFIDEISARANHTHLLDAVEIYRQQMSVNSFVAISV